MDALMLAAALPSTRLLPTVAEGSGARIDAVAIPGYISPQLLESTRVPGAAAALIVAPAAAGKSTSGIAMAARAEGVYLDLAGKRVGDGSFTGLLDEAFGEDDGLAFRKSLKCNEASLVIDALDEAQLASQEVSFVAFLRGMCRYLRTSKGVANVILLARRDTASYVIAAFEDENVGLNVYEIDYFNEAQSENFIASKLDKLFDASGSNRAHRQHVALYQQARDSLFDRLAIALGKSTAAEAWGSSDGKRLLGYSPVLEGLAAYLCVQDFRVIDVDGALGRGMGEWSMLTQLLEDLLTREQTKMLGSWPDEIQRAVFTDSCAIPTLYAPLEQCELLLARAWGLPLTAPVNTAIPPELENEYADAVKTQLLNHPFLSSPNRFVNSLFEDLATAIVLHQTEDEGLRRGALQRLRADEILASPALGPFIIAMADDSEIPAHLISVIIESIVSREDATLEYHFQITGHERAELRINSDIDRPGSTHSLSVRLTGLEKGLSLPARVRNLRVDGVDEVTLPADVTRLGPNVQIAAGTIWFQGSEIHIDASELVEIEAVNLYAEWQQREFIHGSELVVVGTEGEGWPSRRMRQRSTSDEDSSVLEYLDSLRKLMRFFRRTQHVAAGESAARREELDTQLLKHDDRAQAILKEIRRRGWLTDEGPDFILAPEFFAHLDTSITAIRSYEFNSSTRHFVQELAR